MGKHTKETALKSLLKKGVKIDNEINDQLNIKKNSLGNGSLGRLSYLEKKHGYFVKWLKS